MDLIYKFFAIAISLIILILSVLYPIHIAFENFENYEYKRLKDPNNYSRFNIVWCYLWLIAASGFLLYAVFFLKIHLLKYE